MSTTTTNYGLIKPDITDPILIGQLNDNADTIDATMKSISDALDVAKLGIKYKGEVNYYADLPNSAEIGDAYTVKYAGSSGTTPDGTEYVWGTVSGTNQWINFSKDSYTKAEVDALLALKQNALTTAQLAAVNSGIDSEKVAQYDSTTELEAKDRAALVEIVDGGAKNKLPNKGTMTKDDVTYTWTNGDVVVSGTKSSGTNYVDVMSFIPLSDIGLNVGDTIVISNNGTDCYLSIIFWSESIGYTASSDVVAGNNVVTIPTGYTHIIARVGVKSAVTGTISETIQPMICTKAAWDISHEYQPYRPSYQELYERVVALEQANQ